MKNWLVLNKKSNFYLQYRLNCWYRAMTGRGCHSYLVHKASDEREEITGYWRYSVGRSNRSWEVQHKSFPWGNQKINKSLLLNRRGVKWLKFLWRHNADKVPPISVVSGRGFFIARSDLIMFKFRKVFWRFR